MKWELWPASARVFPDAPPAAMAISANSSTLMGASSLGFTMTELPAASAGAIFLTAMSSG